MERDYQKDNFSDLDNLLQQAAQNYNVDLRGSIFNYIGCTTNEIKDVMYTTLKSIVPENEVKPYLDKVDALMV